MHSVDNTNPWGWGRGGGQRLRLEAVPGTRVQRYMINFSEPYLLHTEVSGSFSAFFYNRRYREYDEERLGGRVALGYQFPDRPDLTGSFAFRAAKISVYNPAIRGVPELEEVLGDNGLYGFRVALAHDTRDHQFLATEGYLLEMAFEQVIGSYNYPRGEIDFRKYYRIHERPDGSGRHVLSLSGRVGVTGSNTPLYDHYLTLQRDWGWSVMEDQAWAGGIMWAGGDAIFVAALLLTVAAWLRHEERENRREDARLARRRAAERKATAGSSQKTA